MGIFSYKLKKQFCHDNKYTKIVKRGLLNISYL